MKTTRGRTLQRGLSVILIIITLIVPVSVPGVAGNRPDSNFVSPPAPQSWSGYLLDGECARARKATETDLGPKHTTKCLKMPACDHSGYGLLTDNNEYLRFDEDGNRQARELVAKARIQANWRIVVQGRRSGDVLQVRRIKVKFGTTRSLSAVSEAPSNGKGRDDFCVWGRFRYSDLKEAALFAADAMGFQLTLATHLMRRRKCSPRRRE
jgi:hypothetical protein